MKLFAKIYLIGLFVALVGTLVGLVIRAHVVLIALEMFGIVAAMILFSISIMWAIGEAVD